MNVFWDENTHGTLICSLSGWQTGCVEELEKATGASVQDIQDRFCGSIYNEVLREVKDGAVDILNQDLFLEQG